MKSTQQKEQTKATPLGKLGLGLAGICAAVSLWHAASAQTNPSNQDSLQRVDQNSFEPFFEQASVEILSEGGTGKAEAFANSSLSAKFSWKANFLVATLPCPQFEEQKPQLNFCKVFLPTGAPEQLTALINSEAVPFSAQLQSELAQPFVAALNETGLPVRIWGAQEGTDAQVIALNFQRMATRQWGAPFLFTSPSIHEIQDPHSETQNIQEGDIAFEVSQTTVTDGKNVSRNSNSQNTALQITSSAQIRTLPLQDKSTTKLTTLEFSEHQNAGVGGGMGESNTHIQIKSTSGIPAEISTQEQVHKILESLSWNSGKSPWIFADARNSRMAALRKEFGNISLPQLQSQMEHAYQGLTPQSSIQESLKWGLQLQDALEIHPEWAQNYAKWALQTAPQSQLFADLLLALRKVGNEQCQSALVEIAKGVAQNFAASNLVLLEIGFLKNPGAQVANALLEAQEQKTFASSAQTQDTLDLMAASVARKIAALQPELAPQLTQEARAEIARSATPASKFRSLLILGNSALPQDTKTLANAYFEAQAAHDELLQGAALNSLRFTSTHQGVEFWTQAISEAQNLSTPVFDSLLQALQNRSAAGMKNIEIQEALQKIVQSLPVSGRREALEALAKSFT